MALAGNLSLLTITDADLEARRVALSHYRPQSQTSWSSQIEAAKDDALADFYALKGHDPEWVKAERDDSWRRILVFYALALIFAGIRGDEARAEEGRWRQYASDAMEAFRYRIDSDRDGILEETDTAEAGQSVREVEWIR